MTENSSNSSNISFFESKISSCPICQNSFKKEVIRAGRGRLIAGELMSDLRRRYIPSAKYGYINPLIYNPVVCSKCHYAAFPEDFFKVPNESKKQIKESEERRKKHANMLFGAVDYDKPRDMYSGAQAFFLASTCYTCFPLSHAPNLKKALAAIRASWCISDLHQKEGKKNFDKLYVYFRLLASSCYDKAVFGLSKGSENIPYNIHMGPDLDTNFGYEGTLYMTSLLNYEQRQFIPKEEYQERFKRYKISLSKIFGLGKSSKQKPSALLDKAREIYNNINKEVVDE